MRSASSGGGSRAGSACSKLIDVTSNAPLLLPPAATAASLEAEGAHNYLLLDVPVTREQLCHYRNAAEMAHSELAALLVKYECAQAELLDLKSKLASKVVSIHELKAEVEGYKENNARQSSLLSSMQNRLQEIEKESGTIAMSKQQVDLKAQALLQENLELKGTVHEQEGQIRKYLNESEEMKIQASKASREHSEFITHLCNFFDMGIRGKEEPQEQLLSKISGMNKENVMLKGQIATLKETVNVHEMESKANRETIMRLVSELSNEQKKTVSCSQDMEKLSNDLSSATTAKQNLEKETRNLQGRLGACQRAWEASQEELSHLKKCCSEKEEKLKSIAEEARAEKCTHKAFKDQITTLLGSNSVTVRPSNEDIMKTIQEMCHGEESKTTMLSQLEAQIAKLTETLEAQTKSHQEALQMTRKAESKSETLHNQLMRLEGELVSGDVIQDSLKLEKENYLQFLDQLSEKMNLNHVTADIGFDMRFEAILARVEQLTKLEGHTLTENKIMARNLQRKLKTQKEQLDNKVLQMKLLRQKIVQLEEEKQVRTALAVERDEANLTVRKLQKKLDRLQNELALARETNTDLKVKLADINELKYLQFLDQLSEKMNLNHVTADIGFDMRFEAILARVEQLTKLEGHTLTENKIMARNLQRKLKTQKEQLDNKVLQMKLLRQKIVQLEEEKQVRTALAVERDEANLTVRKLQKKLDRLQNELALARETNTDLKVKLADINELKIRTLEQDRTIEDLSKSQEKLEKMKMKTEKQLTSVKSELHVLEHEAKEDKEKAKNMLESVTSELATLKAALEAVMKKERQLADFREVISRMLGLNIATVALPDYEIITRLEGLIHSHQHHFVPCVCFKDMAVRQDGPLQLLH